MTNAFLNKSINYLIYLLLFLLPWQITYILTSPVINNGEYIFGSIRVYGIDLLIILLLVLTLYKHFFIEKIINKSLLKKLLPLGLLIILGFTSLLWANDKMLGLYYSLKLLETGILILCLTTNTFKTKTALLLIVASSLLQAIIGFSQFIYQSDIFGNNKWLGISAHNPNEPGVSVVDTGLRRWLRAYGLLPHPNILGGFIASGLLIAIYYYHQINLKFLLLKDDAIKKIKKHRVSILLVISLLLLGLLATFSRSAIFGFGCGLLIMLILFFKNNPENKKQLTKSWLNIVVLLAIVSVSFLLMYQPVFKTRLMGQQRLENKSINERIDYSKQALIIAQNNWLLGTGIGNYTTALQTEINEQLPGYNYQPVHNIYILFLVEFGILGLIFVLYLLRQLIKYFFSDTKNILLASLLIMYAIIGLFDHYFLTIHFGIILLATIIGLTIKEHIKT